ncbi:aminopeptidase [Vibrio sp. STUT-A11]|nr:aminopeptidase [Vibrio sp. STUT-A11]
MHYIVSVRQTDQAGRKEMDWYLAVLKKYAVFNGRARRKEYWMFFLFNLLITIVLEIIDGILGTALIGAVYGLAVLIPSIAVTVRRLHDIGRTGWWALIGLIPILGLIVLIIFAATEGNRGRNEYGSDPKETDEAYA